MGRAGQGWAGMNLNPDLRVLRSERLVKQNPENPSRFPGKRFKLDRKKNVTGREEV